jgi:hypothetical protein
MERRRWEWEYGPSSDEEARIEQARIEQLLWKYEHDKVENRRRM